MLISSVRFNSPRDLNSRLSLFIVVSRDLLRLLLNRFVTFSILLIYLIFKPAFIKFIEASGLIMTGCGEVDASRYSSFFPPDHNRKTK